MTSQPPPDPYGQQPDPYGQQQPDPYGQGTPPPPPPPGSQPQYGQPQYGGPPPGQPGYPPPGGYAPPPPPPSGGGTNTMAILALVLAFVFWPAAIICGHIAKKQIAERGEEGSGLATAGLVLGYIFGGITLLSCCLLGIGIIAADSSASAAALR